RHHKQLRNAELGTIPNKPGITAPAICILYSGKIAGAHKDFRLRQQPPQLSVTRKRLHEAEMNGVEDRIEDRADAAFGGGLRRTQERIEVTMARRHQHWRGPGFSGEIKRCLIETKEELRACQSASA